MKTSRKRPNSTFVELLAGIGIFGIIGGLLIFLLISEEHYESLKGFGLGVMVSAGMLIHMYMELEKSLYLGEEGALKHIRATTGLRMVVVAGILILAAWSGVVDIISSLVGVMALKVSAYLWPLTHKLFTQYIRKGR